MKLRTINRRISWLLALAAALGFLFAGARTTWASGDSQVKVEEAKALFQDGDYAAALKLLEEAIAVEPNNVEALQYAGMCQMRLGSPAKALDYFQKASALRPDDATLREDVAWAAVEANQPDVALEAADAALGLNPQSERAMVLKARALIEKGSYDEATALLDQVSPTGEYGQAAAFFKAVALAYQGRNDEAAAEFDRAAELNPGTEMAKKAQDYAEALRTGGAKGGPAKPYTVRYRLLYQYDSNMALTSNEDLMPEQLTNKEDGRIAMDLDARYWYLSQQNLSAYARYIGYQSFQMREQDMNISYHLGQLGSFYRFKAGELPVRLGSKLDYAWSGLEGSYYATNYRVAPEIAFSWTPNLVTRVVGDFDHEVFEASTDDENNRDNDQLGGTIYTNLLLFNQALNLWTGYAYHDVAAEGQNYNRYIHTGLAGAIIKFPNNIESTIMFNFDDIDYYDRAAPRLERKTRVNLALEFPIVKGVFLYTGASYSTVDSNIPLFEYERWIYSGGLYLEL